MKDYEKLVREVMKENNLYGEVYSKDFRDHVAVYVEINWGDWKHDHARTRLIVSNALKPDKHFETTLEQDGSDCYSARHTFVFNKPKNEIKPLVFEEG